jgi:Ring finger domain
MAILVVLIMIIIVAAWFTNRIRPLAIIPDSVRNQRRREEERYRKETRSYLLDSLPVMRYSTRLLPNDQRDREARDSQWNTYSPRGQLQPMLKIEEPRAVHTERAVTGKVDAYKVEMMANPDRPGDEARIPPGDDTLQNGSQSKSSISRTDCSVCTENFAENETVRILPCGHIYHRCCIDPWLLDFGGTCPLW